MLYKCQHRGYPVTKSVTQKKSNNFFQHGSCSLKASDTRMSVFAAQIKGSGNQTVFVSDAFTTAGKKSDISF